PHRAVSGSMAFLHPEHPPVSDPTVSVWGGVPYLDIRNPHCSYRPFTLGTRILAGQNLAHTRARPPPQPILPWRDHTSPVHVHPISLWWGAVSIPLFD